jgi:glutamate N-acetyltransferase / amino-acid N-acetyltransferase
MDEQDLEKLTDIMRSDVVPIEITLGTGEAGATVWGCDLSADYVHINADYTT